MSFFIQNLFSDAPGDRQFFIAVVISVVISICLHELAHGWMAIRLGDDTPSRTGHMTLNPFVHMGSFSLIMLVLTGISWGMMPVDPTRLRGKYAEGMVAFAGPAMNLLLVIIALPLLVVLLKFTDASLVLDAQTPLDRMVYLLYIFSQFNIVLALLNLMPIPPLDGSRILANLWRPYNNLISDPAKLGFLNILLVVIFLRAGSYLFPLADKLILNTLLIFNVFGQR